MMAVNNIGERHGRRFARIARSHVLLPTSPPSSAQGYPTRPCAWWSGSGGGPTDAIAAIVAQKLSDHLGHQFFVEMSAAPAVAPRRSGRARHRTGTRSWRSATGSL